MISAVLSILFTGWIVSLWFATTRIIIPLIATHFAERRWQRLHPGLPLSRRARG